MKQKEIKVLRTCFTSCKDSWSLIINEEGEAVSEEVALAFIKAHKLHNMTLFKDHITFPEIEYSEILSI